jgi:hypothetical protein
VSDHHDVVIVGAGRGDRVGDQFGVVQRGSGRVVAG